MDDLVYWFGSIVGGAWDTTNGQRRKTLAATMAATVLLLCFWFLLLVANAYVMAGPADEPDAERVERIIETSGTWLAWLPLVVGVAMWPIAVVIGSRLVGLHGVGPRFVVAVGCLMLMAMLLVGFVIVTAG